MKAKDYQKLTAKEKTHLLMIVKSWSNEDRDYLDEASLALVPQRVVSSALRWAISRNLPPGSATRIATKLGVPTKQALAKSSKQMVLLLATAIKYMDAKS